MPNSTREMFERPVPPPRLRTSTPAPTPPQTSSKYSSSTILNALLVACVAHRIPVYAGVVHTRERVKFCRATFAHKMYEFFISNVSTFFYRSHAWLVAWLHASDLFPSWMDGNNTREISTDTFSLTFSLISQLKSYLTKSIIFFTLIRILILIFHIFSETNRKMNTSNPDTPVKIRQNVPNKSSSTKAVKPTFQSAGAVLPPYVKTFYPEEQAVTQQILTSACLKYNGLRFGLDELKDQNKALAEFRVFTRFFNNLSVAITEVFVVLAQKTKYDRSGFQTFLKLQTDFVRVGNSSELQKQLVGKYFQKKMSPSKTRVLRGIDREQVMLKSAEYRTVKTEKCSRFPAEFFGKIPKSIFSGNSNFQFFFKTFFFRRNFFFRNFFFPPEFFFRNFFF